MGIKQSDCTGCGAPVGFIDRHYCCRCTAQQKEKAARAACPRCGQQRVLQADTGRCITCSRVCTACGHPVRSKSSTLCRTCSRESERAAAKAPCSRCGRPGYLREDTGWCGHCSRPRQTRQPPRACDQCGRVRKHAGLGLCSACWQRHPDRPFVRAEHLIAEIDNPPYWLQDFTADLAAKYSVGRACTMITSLGRLLRDGQPDLPQSVLERSRHPGRSMGSLARALETFFTSHGLAMATDQAERLAAGRRQRRILAVPEPLRSPAEAFADFMIRSRERSRRAGTLPRTDATIETALTIVRDLSLFLAGERGKRDWALTDVHDLEAFMAGSPKARKRRLVVLGQFFRFARSQKIVLIDPARGLTARGPIGFTGATLTLDQQRVLFRRWTTDPAVHPHEALLGMLALLHGASSREVKMLQAVDLDCRARTARLGNRPHPVPLDPPSWAAVERCLAHREGQRTDNPHVMVTRQTKSGRGPASTAYVSHVLDACGFPPRMIRCTRLLDLVNTMDPKLVAAAFGMDPEATMIYLADHVDPGRLPDP
ncbi:tyrosine-type recombinase/integrase [Streptomyces subrutilus]|uniref:tyrosine-type recombinase/integrase n=1 Tax=Streptomyces subrutilus TaxID=36818 RepID=UPI000AEBC673|nr:integrase [Streptomyces subrutilus]